MATGKLAVEGFFDPATSTISYLLMDAGTRNCALIDTVLDYDPKSGRTRTATADRLAACVESLGARVQWILETHVHADHLSAAPYLKARLGGQIAIGAQVTRVQAVFGKLFNAGPEFCADGSQFDRVFDDDETFNVGDLSVRVMHTPGHTPACVTYVASDGSEEAAFVGDTLFTPDYGTARCDFPGGDAAALYRSIQRILGLAPQTRLYLCHDYQPGGRPLLFETTVAEQREQNIHVHDGIDEASFIAMRTARDATLAMPALILPSVQVNMRAGHLPPPESDGVSYIKVPVDAL
ncbi:putative metallo-beta-lactamase family protein [Paraburkholderia atlantica]|uniref:Metallo-beta-lactamase family protein n=1 Tax=Paraburkholderia atlantica TaxID=2654982 RepID=D5WMY3_PARAM|nr:MBL fold metallo-hydrolase [Paraburkholderia atlantica]ADG20579.1 putative metallo-beta-lactamase family protein [Paraburkholderia atlantica]